MGGHRQRAEARQTCLGGRQLPRHAAKGGGTEARVRSHGHQLCIIDIILFHRSGNLFDTLRNYFVSCEQGGPMRGDPGEIWAQFKLASAGFHYPANVMWPPGNIFVRCQIFILRKKEKRGANRPLRNCAK